MKILCFILLLHSALSAQIVIPKDSIWKEGYIFAKHSQLFEIEKTTLKKEARPFLDSIVLILKTYPELVIEIGNHGDTRPREEYGRNLSFDRAKTLRDYFLQQGIAAKRLLPVGYQGEKPIIPASEIAKIKNSETVEWIHRYNRRTEFKILKVERAEE